jgi:hypothetical protein
VRGFWIALALIAAILGALKLVPWLPDEAWAAFSKLLDVRAPAVGHGASWDGRTFRGYLTAGCGDIFVYAPSGGTWRVEMPVPQKANPEGLDKLFGHPRRRWMTSIVEIEGSLTLRKSQGFFGQHVGLLEVGRVVNTRYPEFGQSVAVTPEPKRYVGYMTLGEEGVGFASVRHKDEFWSVVQGKLGRDAFSKPFVAPLDYSNPSSYTAYVEIHGRVGPPGSYAHLGDYEREIAVDGFRYLRPLKPGEIDDTALVGDLPFDGKGRGGARINHCLPPLALP